MGAGELLRSNALEPDRCSRTCQSRASQLFEDRHDDSADRRGTRRCRRARCSPLAGGTLSRRLSRRAARGASRRRRPRQPRAATPSARDCPDCADQLGQAGSDLVPRMARASTSWSRSSTLACGIRRCVPPTRCAGPPDEASRVAWRLTSTTAQPRTAAARIARRAAKPGSTRRRRESSGRCSGRQPDAGELPPRIEASAWARVSRARSIRPRDTWRRSGFRAT